MSEDIHPELGYNGCVTVYEGFRRTASLQPQSPCMGARKIDASGNVGPYVYLSYSECLARVDCFAAGLDALGLVKLVDEPQCMKTLCIYMKNCLEWILSEQAAFTLGAATVPLYDTLGPNVVSFILNQTYSQTVICTLDEVEKLCQVKEESDRGTGTTIPYFSTIIVLSCVPADVARRVQSVGLEILPYARVEAVGRQRISTQGFCHRPPSPDDVSTFCYTSGTTGNPKGALITHKNMMSYVAGIKAHPNLMGKPGDRHFSYLPLPHIFERTYITQVLIGGASVAFFRGDLTYMVEDLKACRPTFLIVVPRILTRIYDKVKFPCILSF